jgi:hypothetical protein
MRLCNLRQRELKTTLQSLHFNRQPDNVRFNSVMYTEYTGYKQKHTHSHAFIPTSSELGPPATPPHASVSPFLDPGGGGQHSLSGTMPPLLAFIIFNIRSYNTIIPSFILHHFPKHIFLDPHRFYAQQEKPSWGAEPRFELGPALQQADALPTLLRRTLSELRRTLTDLRRTLV